MWTLCQGIFGQSQGRKGLFHDFWASLPRWTKVAISLSRLGHQTCSRLSDFIRTIPGCPVCNLCNTCSRSCLGIITQIPQSKLPTSTVISWHLLKYCVTSGASGYSGQPVIINCNTLDNIGSFRLAFRTWSTSIGRDSICNKLMSFASSTPSFDFSRCIDKRDRQSAFACFSVDRYSISYLYAARSSAHLCNRVAAKVGIPLFGPSTVVNGLWSVTKRNFLP